MTEIKLTGLYNHVDENGNKYLCGKWGHDAWLTVKVNYDKKTPDQPDCFVYLSEVYKREEKKNDHASTNNNGHS